MHGQNDEEEIAAWGAGVYATYRLHNAIRAGGPVVDDLDGAFRQYLRAAFEL